MKGLKRGCEQSFVVLCIHSVSLPSDILFSYKSQTDEIDNDEVILPHQPIDYSTADGDAAAADIGNSYDSTHFTLPSPNPLYHIADYQHDLLPSISHLTFNERMAMSGNVNA